MSRASTRRQEFPQWFHATRCRLKRGHEEVVAPHAEQRPVGRPRGVLEITDRHDDLGWRAPVDGQPREDEPSLGEPPEHEVLAVGRPEGPAGLSAAVQWRQQAAAHLVEPETDLGERLYRQRDVPAVR